MMNDRHRGCLSLCLVWMIVAKLLLAGCGIRHDSLIHLSVNRAKNGVG